MSNDEVSPRPVPRWVQRWAVATVALTAVPVAYGGWVTTRGVGMSDPVWPTTPWYLLFADWTEPRPGFIIEHTHRLAGYMIGAMVLVLTWGLWKRSRSPALRWLGVATLAAVLVQGMLGGIRVVWHELAGTELAIVHGCFAQLFFALLTGTSVLCFPVRAEGNASEADLRRMRRLSVALAAVVFVQIVWGAVLRHAPNPAVQRLHLLMAFAVVGFAVLVIRVAGAPQFGRRYARARIALMALLTLQLLLGVEAWMGKFPAGVLPELVKLTAGQVQIRILHVLVGAGVFATSVSFALMACLPAGVRVEPLATEPLGRPSAAAQPVGGTA